MKLRFGLLGILCFGCMANRGVIEPYSYVPKSSSSMHQMPLDMGLPEIENRADPITLTELVDIALRNNPSTKITWAKARAAAALWGQAQSAYFPTLSGLYSMNRSKESSLTSIPGTTLGATQKTSKAQVISQSSTTWGPQLQLSYTLLDFGLTSANVRSAKEALLSADFTHNYQIQTVLQQIASDYYNYLSQKQQLKAQEADLDTACITEQAVKAEVDAGVKDISDLLQAQTTLLQTQIRLTNQKQNVINAKAALLTDVGLGAHSNIEIADTIEVPSLDIIQDNIAEILTIALSKRSDLLAAEASLRSEEANVDATWRQFLPNVTYELSATHAKVKPGGNLGLNYSGLLSLNFPIFSGFSTLNELRKAQSIRDQTAATLRQTELAITEQVITSHATVQTAFETLQFSDKLLSAAQEQYDVALARYKAGVGDIIELITAQNTLAVSRAQNVSSTTSWLTSIVNLSFAAGTLAPTSMRAQ